MKAPIFRAWLRPCPRFGVVWQLRQPCYPGVATGEQPTRPAALRDVLHNARHFQNCHTAPVPLPEVVWLPLSTGEGAGG